MTSPSFGAKPLVLRCSRCGRFVDWAEARLQVVDGCRAHLDLPPVLVRPSESADRQICIEMFESDFGHTTIVAFGDQVPLAELPVLVAEMKGEVAGALAYRLLPDALHIAALATSPMWQRSGVGGHLVAEAELVARQQHLPRVIVSTTNDNLPAMYFYQRHQFEITDISVGGLRPHTTAVGFGGIPVRDEIRMAKKL